MVFQFYKMKFVFVSSEFSHCIRASAQILVLPSHLECIWVNMRHSKPNLAFGFIMGKVMLIHTQSISNFGSCELWKPGLCKTLWTHFALSLSVCTALIRWSGIFWWNLFNQKNAESLNQNCMIKSQFQWYYWFKTFLKKKFWNCENIRFDTFIYQFSFKN